MEYLGIIIPLLAILGGLAIAIIALITEHKQKIMMIERGINNIGYSSPGLRSGITFSFLGFPLIFFLNSYETLIFNIPPYAPGGLLIAVGLSQLVYFLVERRERRIYQKKFAGNNSSQLSN